MMATPRVLLVVAVKRVCLYLCFACYFLVLIAKGKYRTLFLTFFWIWWCFIHLCIKWFLYVRVNGGAYDWIMEVLLHLFMTLVLVLWRHWIDLIFISVVILSFIINRCWYCGLELWFCRSWLEFSSVCF